MKFADYRSWDFHQIGNKCSLSFTAIGTLVRTATEGNWNFTESHLQWRLHLVVIMHRLRVVVKNMASQPSPSFV